MDILSQLPQYVIGMSLIFARCLGLLTIAPVVSTAPFVIRVLLSLLFAWIFWPLLEVQLLELQPSWLVYSDMRYIAFLLGEVLMGIGLGLGIHIFFFIFQGIAAFVSLPLGLSAAQFFDPYTQEESSVLAQFFYIASVFAFLEIQGIRQVFLVGVYESFYQWNMAQIVASYSSILPFLQEVFVDFFYYSLLLSLPLLATLLLITISTGFLAKAAPQMNLLIVGFPITLLAGFTLLFFVLPSLLNSYALYLQEIFDRLKTLAPF